MVRPRARVEDQRTEAGADQESTAAAAAPDPEPEPAPADVVSEDVPDDSPAAVLGLGRHWPTRDEEGAETSDEDSAAPTEAREPTPASTPPPPSTFGSYRGRQLSRETLGTLSDDELRALVTAANQYPHTQQLLEKERKEREVAAAAAAAATPPTPAPAAPDGPAVLAERLLHTRQEYAPIVERMVAALPPDKAPDVADFFEMYPTVAAVVAELIDSRNQIVQRVSPVLQGHQEAQVVDAGRRALQHINQACTELSAEDELCKPFNSDVARDRFYTWAAEFLPRMQVSPAALLDKDTLRTAIHLYLGQRAGEAPRRAADAGARSRASRPGPGSRPPGGRAGRGHDDILAVLDSK